MPPEKRNSNGVNLVHTPLNQNCRLCHVAGFSNLCTYSLGGDCPYMSLKKSLKDLAAAE